MRPLTLLGIVLLTSAILAGCHEPAPTDGEETGLTLQVDDPPETVTTGEGLNLTVQVEANEQVVSEHSGFHYGFNPSAELEPDDYTIALTEVSPHVTSEHSFPGEYLVENWTLDPEDAGRTVYYRAHTIADGTHYWGEELTFELE